MGNVKLLFCGSEHSRTENHTLEVYANCDNEIYLEVDSCNGLNSCFIVFDKSTAIKLSRELRKQIALLED